MLENSEYILRTFIEVQMNNLLAGYGNIMRLFPSLLVSKKVSRLHHSSKSIVYVLRDKKISLS